MTDRPPTRFDEEGKSFNERDRGKPTTSVEIPGEPEKLSIPAEAVAQLLQLAVQSPGGNLWWQGFVTAHGLPSWIGTGHWRFAVRAGAEVVPDHATGRENGRN